MRLAYLKSSARDLAWMRHYYGRVFPQGAAAAQQRFRAVEALLRDNPYAGRPIGSEGARRLAVSRTPFLFVYRVAPTRIEILRVPDSRSLDSTLLD